MPTHLLFKPKHASAIPAVPSPPHNSNESKSMRTALRTWSFICWKKKSCSQGPNPDSEKAILDPQRCLSGEADNDIATGNLKRTTMTTDRTQLHSVQQCSWPNWETSLDYEWILQSAVDKNCANWGKNATVEKKNLRHCNTDKHLQGIYHNCFDQSHYTHNVYQLSTHCLHAVDTLCTPCLHLVYTLSTHCLDSVFAPSSNLFNSCAQLGIDAWQMIDAVALLEAIERVCAIQWTNKPSTGKQ